MSDKLCPLKNKLDVFRQTCEAIDFAHRQKVIHRDLKPANVMITHEGVAKVMDFGLAKSLGEGNINLSRDGQVLGTPKYMSPEQADGSRKIDRSTDIYSLGVILYEILTGRTPYEGETVINILSQLATRDPIPPRELNPDISRDLETICLKCLEKNTRRRYASARNLAKDIDAFLNNRPVSVRPPNLLELTVKWMQRNKILTGLFIMLFVAVIAMFVALMSMFENQRLIEEKQKLTQERLASAEYESGCTLFHEYKFTEALAKFHKSLEEYKLFETHWMLACTYFIQQELKGNKNSSQDLSETIIKNLDSAIEMAKKNSKLEDSELCKLYLLQTLIYMDKGLATGDLENLKNAERYFENAKEKGKSLGKIREGFFWAQTPPWPMGMDNPSEKEFYPWPNARYYSFVALLPQSNTPKIKDLGDAYHVKENFLEILKWNLFTIEALLNNQNSKLDWLKKIAREIPSSELKEMLHWDATAGWLFNMATPFWIRLPPERQQSYSSAYQKAYFKEPFKKIQYANVEFDMVGVPPGIMWIGISENRNIFTQRESFWAMKYEVSVGQWKSVCKNMPDIYGNIEFQKSLFENIGIKVEIGNSFPVVGVTYSEIVIFMEEIQKKFLNAALPEKNIWEYTARAGSTYRWSWGSDPNKIVKYPLNQPTKTSPYPTQRQQVQPLNAWEIADMEGNVDEICLERPFPINNKEKIRNWIVKGGRFNTILKNVSPAYESFLSLEEVGVCSGIRIFQIK